MVSGIGSSYSYGTMQAQQSMMQRPSAEEIEAKQSEDFAASDTDGDGALTTEEFSSLLESMPGMSESSDFDADEMFSSMDSDGDGSITEDEFKTGMNSYMEENMASMGGGMPGMMGPPPSEEDLEDMFASMDTDEDGSITQEEFEAGMSSLQEDMQSGMEGMNSPMGMMGGMQGMQGMSGQQGMMGGMQTSSSETDATVTNVNINLSTNDVLGAMGTQPSQSSRGAIKDMVSAYLAQQDSTTTTDSVTTETTTESEEVPEVSETA